MMVVFGTIMAALYIQQGYYFVGLLTMLAIACGIAIYYFASIKEDRIAAQVVAFVICIFLFTYDVLAGVLGGIAVLWTLLIPIAFCYFFSVKYGIFLSLYYLSIFLLLFYTPLRYRMMQYYSANFMNRFPILYLCSVLLTSLAMIEYHDGVLFRIDYERRLEDELKKQSDIADQRYLALEEMSDQITETLAEAIDAKDKYTTGHSLRVSHYAGLLATELGLTGSEAEEVRREALLHDIGKIGIPDTVLNKVGALTHKEIMVVQSHTVTGAKILMSLTRIPGAQYVAKYHHERFDGTGYPEGRKGEEIPLHARITTIADAYDAMCSDRIYRHGLKSDEIRRELVQGRGTQFDPSCVDAFVRLMDSGTITSPQDAPDPDCEGSKARKRQHLDDTKADHSVISESLREIFDEKKPGLRVIMMTVTPKKQTVVSANEKDELLEGLRFSVESALGNKAICKIINSDQIMLLYRSPGGDGALLQRRVYTEFFRLRNNEMFELNCAEI